MFTSIKAKDTIALLGYCSLLAAVAPTVALLSLRAWVSGGVVPYAIRQLSAPIGGIGVVAAGAFGVYLGLLVLMWIDNMKRFTALIMTVATGAALFLFETLGVFFRYLTLVNLGAALVGFGAAITVAGGLKLLSGEWDTQFPRASGGFLLVAGLLTTVSYLQVYAPGTANGPPASIFTEQLPLTPLWAGTTNPPVAAAAGGVFIATTFGLVTYEVKESFQVLGPPRAGKTTLQVGFYHVVDSLDNGQTKPNPTRPLSRFHRQFLEADGWGPLDDPTPSLEYNLLKFRYQIGRLFPRFQEVRAYDAAGEHFGPMFLEQLSDMVPSRVLSMETVTYLRHRLADPFISRPEEGSVDSHERMATILAHETVFSDTIVFVIEAPSLLTRNADPEKVGLSEYLGTYQQILQIFDESLLPKKEVHIVVTKADHLRPLYEQYQTGAVGLEGTQEYESFRQFVEYLLKERDDVCPATNEFFRMAPEARVSVVNYEMEETDDDDDEQIPVDPVRVHGFEETLGAMVND